MPPHLRPRMLSSSEESRTMDVTIPKSLETLVRRKVD